MLIQEVRDRFKKANLVKYTAESPCDLWWSREADRRYENDSSSAQGAYFAVIKSDGVTFQIGVAPTYTDTSMTFIPLDSIEEVIGFIVANVLEVGW